MKYAGVALWIAAVAGWVLAIREYGWPALVIGALLLVGSASAFLHKRTEGER